MRKPGWYWVWLRATQQVAKYNSYGKCWLVVGVDRALTDVEFDWIAGEPIQPPENV